MADVATADEILNRRALERERFEQRQRQDVTRPALDLSQVTSKAAAQPASADATAQEAPPNRLTSRLANLRRSARQYTDTGQLAVEATNRSYRTFVDGLQSELIGNVFALEIFVSPWLFLTIYFLRVVGSIFPVRVKRVNLIPPYSMRSAKDIIVLAMHTGAMLLIVIILMTIFVILGYIAWFLTRSLWEQVSIIWDFSTGALKVMYDLVAS
jgi:hypothetical protein